MYLVVRSRSRRAQSLTLRLTIPQVDVRTGQVKRVHIGSHWIENRVVRMKLTGPAYRHLLRGDGDALGEQGERLLMRELSEQGYGPNYAVLADVTLTDEFTNYDEHSMLYAVEWTYKITFYLLGSLYLLGRGHKMYAIHSPLARRTNLVSS